MVNNNIKNVSPSKTDQQSNSIDTHSLTIRASRLPSDGWSGKFTDDHVGMFVTVYDLKGTLIKSGFANENGLVVKGLKNSLYFVYPADCDNCSGTKNDILFQKWEDGSKDRPRLIPADSNIVAQYQLKLESTGNNGNPKFPPQTIQLDLNKETFVAGEKVVISGHVSKPARSNQNEVQIAFYDASGKRFGFLSAGIQQDTLYFSNNQFVIPGDVGSIFKAGT